MTEMEQAFYEYRQINNANLAAVRAAVMALIDTHPDKPTLAVHMNAVAERLASTWLGSELPDLFVSEFQQTMASLQTRAQSV